MPLRPCVVWSSPRSTHRSDGDPVVVMNGLALCAGAGGLELGLRLALGDTYRTVGYVEREAFAAACLVARMEDQTLDPAPVWDDLTTFDGRPWRGRVGLVSAGFPCQPASHAGQRLGTGDERWLWPHVARVVREVGPRLVFIENVPGLLSVNGGRAMREVLGDLAALGFDVEWTRLSAAGVGATQLRERLWLLAHRHDGRLPKLRWEPEHDRDARHDPDGPGGAALARTNGGRGHLGPGAPHHERFDVEPSHRGGDLAHPAGVGEREPHHPTGTVTRDHSRPDSGRRSSGVADPESTRPQGQGLPRRAPQRGLWPPRPDDRDGWARTDGPQPSVRRMADGLAHRLDRLHTTGNGVVPLVAASAFVHLARRAGLLAVIA